MIKVVNLLEKKDCWDDLECIDGGEATGYEVWCDFSTGDYYEIPIEVVRHWEKAVVRDLDDEY